MQTISIREIDFDSLEQKESVQLRYKVLREPLGLQFDKNDLAKEYQDHHIASFIDGQLVGILLLKPTDNHSVLKMRQVAVNNDWQGKGIGRAMVVFSEEFARNKGFNKIELHARETAVPFYSALKYSFEGDLFYEVGIPHRKMFKDHLDQAD